MLKVTWTKPTTGATPTGYIIHYKADGDQGTVVVSNGTTTMEVIYVHSTELVYAITMVTLSTMLPSKLSLPTIYSEI